MWSGLTAIHDAFVREHNRIATIFAYDLRSRPYYISEKDLDEIAYQEARRVVGAELQVRHVIS